MKDKFSKCVLPRAFAGLLASTAMVALVAPAVAEPLVEVAFVLDAELELVPIERLIQQELSDRLSEDYRVRFPEGARAVVNGDRALARAAIDRIYADESIDLLIGLGSVTAVELASRGALPKPSFAVLTADPALLGMARDGESSGVVNFNYLTSPADMESLLTFIARLTPVEHVAILLPGAVTADPELRSRLDGLERSLGVRLDPVAIGAALPLVVSQIPAEADALIAAPLLGHREEEVRVLASALAARGLPAFSQQGRREVQLGFLGTQSPSSYHRALSERLARNAERALEGDDPGTMPVELDARAVAVVNAATAVRLELRAPLSVLVSADVIEREALRDAGRLTLSRAMEESVEVNLDLRAQDRVVASGRANVLLAIAQLLPQVHATYLATAIDSDRAKNEDGRPPEREQRLRGELSQVLFDEKMLADVSISKRNLEASAAFRDQVRLDVIQGTGVAFLEVMRARATERIQNENERVTRENLKLAETRRKLGSAAAGEVYRWRSQLARDERASIYAQRDRRQAELALNRILDRNAETIVDLDPEVFAPVAHVFADARVIANMKEDAGFATLRDWLSAKAMEHAPELRGLDRRIEAQERALASAGREFWTPTLSLRGRLDGILDESGEGAGDRVPNEDDQDWRIGLEASIPVFEGGRRLYQQRRAREVLSELRIRENATRKRIDEAVRAAAYSAWSSLRAIELSRSAADSAARNLDLVTKAYTRGTVSVVDLLDAQNAATMSAEEAENALFDHLIDVLSLQRLIGRFWLFVPEAERRAELDELAAQLPY